jgi:hypothetical protein
LGVQVIYTGTHLVSLPVRQIPGKIGQLHLVFFGRTVAMKMAPYVIAGCLSLLLSGLPAAAADLSWTFQRTGFSSDSSLAFPQTALSMRGGLAWPVVYGTQNNQLQAYSLFPFENPNVQTNWHPIGSSLPLGPNAWSRLMQAESSPTDGFGVVLQSSFPVCCGDPELDRAFVGNSFTGLGPAMPGVRGLAYDQSGNLLAATDGLISGFNPLDEKIFDVSLSRFGDQAAVTQDFSQGTINYWQQSPLLGTWNSTTLASDNDLAGPSLDLLFDASARPHVLGVNNVNQTDNSVVAYRFDIISGTWISTVLESSTEVNNERIIDVTAATDGSGTIGAAWVNNGTLKYAYLDSTQIAPAWQVTTVTDTTPLGGSLLSWQGVGLEFDRNGLPVISYLSDNSDEIWIAYDPPIAVPEPTSLAILTLVAVGLSGQRPQRLLGLAG